MSSAFEQSNTWSPERSIFMFQRLKKRITNFFIFFFLLLNNFSSDSKITKNLKQMLNVIRKKIIRFRCFFRKLPLQLFNFYKISGSIEFPFTFRLFDNFLVKCCFYSTFSISCKNTKRQDLRIGFISYFTGFSSSRKNFDVLWEDIKTKKKKKISWAKQLETKTIKFWNKSPLSCPETQTVRRTQRRTLRT